MGQNSKNEERRQFVRIKKNYIIRFFQKENPSVKYEVSQIENISKGGLCFTSTLPFEVGNLLYLELRTPFITDTLGLDGELLESKEKVKGLIYQNRVRFTNLTSGAIEILEKIEKYNASRGDK